MLWATIGKKLGWKCPRNEKISKLFRREEATVEERGAKISHTRLGRRWGVGDKRERTKEEERIS